MQTLKTAIVVVLLLTVTYSAYIALTAPVPDMSSEVQGLIVGESLDSDFGMEDIDVGMPEGLAAREPEAVPTDASEEDPAGAFPSSYGFADRGSSATTRRLSDQGLSDQERPGEQASAAPSANGGASEFDPLSVPAPQSLPKPDPSSGPAYADPNRHYDRTPYANLELTPDDAPRDGDRDASKVQTNNGAKPTANDFAIPNDSGGDANAEAPADEAAAPSNPSPNRRLVNAIATADRQWQADQLREALTTLSLFYNEPDLSPADREPLQMRLDVLAGEVIYSSRHLLEQPYRVSTGETLQSVAAIYDVPWQLLANINEVQDPAAIVPGQELKVMRGPFRAEVNLDRSELTLFLGELYAGRFAITPGSDPEPQPGTYSVEDKQTARTYYASSGGDIPAGDPRNPYGDAWLDLGSQMCIHGSPQNDEAGGAGCIGMRSADARDVYGILSQGSSVSIMR